MAFQEVKNVSIRGVSCCVPKNKERNIDLPFYRDIDEAQDVIKATGIVERHVATEDMTASDLCIKAAETLIESLGWEKESIDMIAFCTQCPDYLNHPNSFIAHEALGLDDHTMCIDFYHGCPGWIVSLSALGSMMQNGKIKRVLLLDGDTPTRDEDIANREERPLFGDAGTATALEFDKSAKPMFFTIGTSSAAGRALIHPHGGYRNPYTQETLLHELARKAGKLTAEENDSKMESMDIFSFAITKVPKVLKQLCAEYEIDMANIDTLYLHQANKFILDTIAKRLKVESEKVPLGLTHYGNTTSASIPLTMVVAHSEQLLSGHQKNLLCSFGTGLAWAVAYVETEHVVCPLVVEL